MMQNGRINDKDQNHSKRSAPDSKEDGQRTKTNRVILKKNLKGKMSNSKHLRQDSLPERRRGRGVKIIPTLRYN